MGGSNRRAGSSRSRPRHERDSRRHSSASASSDDQLELDDEEFAALLKKRGLFIRDVDSDGSCLFRAVSDQLYGVEDHHKELRARCVRYMRENEDSFAPFIEDNRSFSSYVAEMAKDCVWGGNLELQALSMALRLDVRIHQLAAPVYDIRNSFGSAKPTPIHLSYHQGQHYASVRKLESQDSDGPACHRPLSSGQYGPRERSRASDDSSPETVADSALVKEAEAQAEQTEEKVTNVLKLLRKVRIGECDSAASPSDRQSGRDSAKCREKGPTSASPQSTPAGTPYHPETLQRSLRALELDAGDVRDLVRDAVTRAHSIARREADLRLSEDAEYDRKVQRSKRRMRQMLDASIQRAADLETRAYALAAPPNPDIAQPSKPPVRGKKKQQAAKRAERKARRMREQERAAMASADASAGHGRSSGTSSQSGIYI